MFATEIQRFPAFDKAQGYETILEHGETVFIPSLWWHYIKYVDGGFGLSLRANDSVFTLLKGGMNLAPPYRGRQRHEFAARS